MIQPRISDSPVELRIDHSDDLPWIRSDKTRIRQVLINLCSNALKFTEAGHVLLRVRVAHRGGDRGIVFEVEDTGPGIPSDRLERVCRAFEQADASVSRRHGGAGLGLAISRSIADLLGGSLGLESEPGVGTVARLRLPLVEADPDDQDESHRRSLYHNTAAEPHQPEAWAHPEDRLAGRRVLLAEDGPDNQRLTTFLLRRAGCEVELAADGQEALNTLARADGEQRPFDAILMDVQMPKLDGHSATRALRSRGVKTPVVAITAHTMIGDRERALEAGCDGYLSKPVRAGKLVAELERHIPAR